jgi:phage gp16-like protein
MNHIAAIHTIKSQLAKQGVMTEDDYRALLLQLTGKSSSKELSPLVLAKVREHFDKLAAAHGVPHVAGRKGALGSEAFAKAKAQASPLERKAWALWFALHKAGKVRDKSSAAFRAFVVAQTGKSDIRFCSQAETNSLVERMKQWQSRKDTV